MFNVKKKLSTMMFMESFIFGAWFVPLWQFLSSNGFTPSQIAWSYACTAIASLISPLLVGAIADRFFSAQKVLSFLMFTGAALMLIASQQTEFIWFFVFLMLYSMTYMPTIALANSITFSNISNVDRNFLVFFFVSFMFSVPISFYYTFANGYLTEVGLNNATGWMSLGQFSEIFFMLALPFFIKRFGIRTVLLTGLFTAALRYGFFAFANAEYWYMTSLLFAGILLHGISYDLFFVTGFIYVDKKANNKIRTSAQGLLVLACNGIGQLLGYNIGGALMEKMFHYSEPVNGLTFNWAGIWTFGSIFIAIIFIIFLLFFKEEQHDITETAVQEKDIEVRYMRSEV